jgi:signal transduction histidine kinase
VLPCHNLKMNSPNKEEKPRPFKLYKYFTITSFVFIFIGAIILSYLNTHWAKEMQFQKNEEYAQLLVSNLNHQIFRQFVIPMSLRYGKIQLRDKKQFERMDAIVRGTLHGFKIEMMNIYDLNNIIAYSFDKELMGIKDIGGRGFQNAVLGKSTSEIEQTGGFLEILLGFPKEIKVTTFAPLHAEKSLASTTGPVIGVIEIVQNISDDYKTIFNFQVLVVLTIMLVMAILFLTLTFIVKKGEDILGQKAREQIRLKEQLSQAQHLSSIGEMVAGVSHEIRNPLGIISSSAALLKKKVSFADPGNTIPDVIIEESARLNNIITDFLNFAKPRTPNLTQCVIQEVIDKNISFLSSEAAEKGYRFEIEHAADIPIVMADKEMLYQAFLNLFINGMQSMPTGGVIQIGITANENAVSIQFQDEGHGITEDIEAKIWDPFFTTKEKGTGLGLGIVKKIVELHHGDIQIKNRETSGVVVTVELPIS